MSNGLLGSLEAKIPDMDAVMAIPDSGYGLTLTTLFRDLSAIRTKNGSLR